MATQKEKDQRPRSAKVATTTYVVDRYGRLVATVKATKAQTIDAYASRGGRDDESR
jgi:hypothetical protein